ncbi:hypothetical protein GCM10017783_05960 [Deinococcus piscis]|uniref:N-acetyltransferase domain-containing protein n=1 Tax=Deinococcus piscis TaxID=394230 RepID=A0ABQ3JZH2_9DEIO|nr:GNAT family N-acetyltransferase [Deinococcus piscis]GHF96854.1 hypothetical protein GCM10017783_05960 [Deinococcus piscis]
MSSSLLSRIAHAEAGAHAAQAPAGHERFGPLLAVWTEDAEPLDTAWHDGSRPPTPQEWAAFEMFCNQHGQTPTVHALSHAAPSLLPTLNGRGYHLQDLLHLYTHDLRELPELKAAHVRLTHDAEAWARVAALGFGTGTESIMRAVAQAPGKRLWWAEVDSAKAATGAYSLLDGVAMLHGAATRPEFRGRGLQSGLLAARLHAAKGEGATLATVMVTPDTGSERNVLRAGFKLTGLRLTWTRPA